jgi:hypothetical protein
VLAPKDRTLLLESLRPPPGYRLDAAVSTTFTLNLMALLVAPLAFTYFDWEMDTGEPTTNPNALLEAIRRHADRIDVFCQSGHIAVPAANRMLFSYLENSVHEVRPIRDGGIFHPKVWLVRYVADQGPIKYRMLCASRNLTFDRSWDTVLILDGVAVAEATPKNEKLARFIGALQDMTVRPLPEKTRNTLVELVSELDHVEFELPEHIDDIEFWPLGLAGAQDIWPFPERADRGLVIAPFVTDRTLKQLNITSQQTLISRAEELDKLDPLSMHGYDVSTLSEAAELEQEEGAEADVRIGLNTELSGLHAKLFAYDIGKVGHVWTGSANATSAAFHQNVEFLVELRGKSKDMGVEAILAPQQQGVSVLLDLLHSFTPGGSPPDETTERELEQSLRKLREFVVDLELEVHAEQSDDDLFDLTLRPTKSPSPPGSKIELHSWPLSLTQQGDAQVLSIGADWAVTFASTSFQALTTFFAFEGRVSVDGKSSVCRFMLNLPSSGFPDNRRQRLLRYLLEDRQQVMRYLFLLLGEEGSLSLSDFAGLPRGAGGAENTGDGYHADLPMLEALVKALERSPEKLDHIERLVTELSSSEEGKALLPEDFEQIWQPLWQARKEMAKHGR